MTSPELERYEMGVMECMTYTARDGLDIPAYLTLPILQAQPPSLFHSQELVNRCMSPCLYNNINQYSGRPFNVETLHPL